MSTLDRRQQQTLLALRAWYTRHKFFSAAANAEEIYYAVRDITALINSLRQFDDKVQAAAARPSARPATQT